jgi:hypothetical protein
VLGPEVLGTVDPASTEVVLPYWSVLLGAASPPVERPRGKHNRSCLVPPVASGGNLGAWAAFSNYWVAALAPPRSGSMPLDPSPGRAPYRASQWLGRNGATRGVYGGVVNDDNARAIRPPQKGKAKHGKQDDHPQYPPVPG